MEKIDVPKGFFFITNILNLGNNKILTNFLVVTKLVAGVQGPSNMEQWDRLQHFLKKYWLLWVETHREYLYTLYTRNFSLSNCWHGTHKNTIFLVSMATIARKKILVFISQN